MKLLLQRPLRRRRQLLRRLRQRLRAAPAAAAVRGGGGVRAAGGGGGGRARRRRPRAGGAGRHHAQLPYDVTGWTLPMQMGVEVVAVTEPVDDATRRTLRKIERVEPMQGKVEGSGPVFAFSHNSNAALRAVNEILAAAAR